MPDQERSRRAHRDRESSPSPEPEPSTDLHRVLKHAGLRAIAWSCGLVVVAGWTTAMFEFAFPTALLSLSIVLVVEPLYLLWRLFEVDLAERGELVQGSRGAAQRAAPANGAGSRPTTDKRQQQSSTGDQRASPSPETPTTSNGHHPEREIQQGQAAAMGDDSDDDSRRLATDGAVPVSETDPRSKSGGRSRRSSEEQSPGESDDKTDPLFDDLEDAPAPEEEEFEATSGTRPEDLEIVCDEDVLDGIPRFKESGIPVHLVADRVADEEPIVPNDQGITEAHLERAKEYAATNPAEIQAARERDERLNKQAKSDADSWGE